MPILQSHRIIFVHIPRTAGTTIEKAMGICGNDNRGCNDLNTSLFFGFDGQVFLQHLYATEIRERLGERSFDCYFRFAIVRNPFARLLSAFHNSFHKRYTFDRFITRIVPQHLRQSLHRDKARHLKLQYDFLHDKDGNRLVDFVGRQESLAKDLCAITEKTGFSFAINDHHRPKAADYRTAFNDRHQRLAELYYERDCEAFSYHFNETTELVG